VKLFPSASVIGNAGPEYENCAVDTDALSIITVVLLVLEIVTDIGALFAPTVVLGNCSEVVLAVVAANAAMLHTNITARIIAAPNTFT
jgi:hypothetical protein